MKQRFGGLLVMALGLVLVVSGLSSSPAATVGIPITSSSTVITTTTDGSSTSTPCESAEVGGAPTCPEGTIEIQEQTKEAEGLRAHAAQAPQAPPDSWTITITSNCALPGGSSPTVAVPTAGSATSDPLYVFASTSSTTKCSYTLTETPVTGYTATFTPPSPVELPGTGPYALTVQLRNVASATPISTAVPSSTSVAPIPTPTVAPSQVVTPGATLPLSGPEHRIGPTVIAGLVLLLGGLVLVVAADPRRRRTPRRTD